MSDEVRIYVVARCYGSWPPDAPEKYGMPLAAFADPGDAGEYAGASGLSVTEVTLW